MKNRTIQLFFIAFTFLLSQRAFAVWNEGEIWFEQSLTQNSGSGSTPIIGSEYSFRATARNTKSGQTQTLAIPGGSQILIDNLQGAHFVYSQSFSSSNNLFSTYPIGDYTFTITRDYPPVFVLQPTLTVSENSFPLSAPTIIGGTWRDGRLLVDATAPTISWEPWINAPVDSSIGFELWRNGGAGGALMGSNSTSITWFSQPVGAVFDAWLSFRILTDSETVYDPYNSDHDQGFRAGFASTVYFQLEIIPEPSTFILIAVGISFIAFCTRKGRTRRCS